MNLAGKKIAILGGNRLSCEIVRTAKRLGVMTTVIDYNPVELSPAKQIADDTAMISIADTDEVADYLRKHEIDGVVTGYTDSILGWYADICEKAHLNCYGTHRQFDIFTNKQEWKELCRAYGVPTSREYKYLDVLNDPNGCHYPLMVKPADGSGARGTHIVNGPGDFEDAYKDALSYTKKNSVIIEDYLEGAEVTVFWLFIDGVYRVFLLGNRHVKHNQEGVIPLPAGYTFPSNALPSYIKEIAPNVKKMLSSVGVTNGMMFHQCILKDGIPYVYDIGFRLTGSLEHYLTSAIAGYNPIEMLIHFAITGRMSDDPDLDGKIEKALYAPCFNISCLMKPGTIDHFSGLSKIEACEDVAACVKAHIEGETLPEQEKGRLSQIALRILGTTDAVGKLEPTMLSLQNAIEIVSPSGDELMLPGLESSDFEGVLLDV